MRISPELCVSIKPDIANSEPEQSSWEISPGSEHPWAIVKRTTIPTSAVKVEVIDPIINKVIWNSDCYIQTKRRRINELR
jgi:hypothetical protein